jgi:hypothetical protein
MTLEELIFAEIPVEKLQMLTKEELIILLKGEQSIRHQLQKRLNKAEAIKELLAQQTMLVADQLITIRKKLYGKSSEKSPKQVEEAAVKSSQNKEKKKRVLLPSERYPNAPLIEQHITLDAPPACACCESQMVDSGMTEDSEL